MDRAETPIRILREAPYAELVPEPEFHVSQNVPKEVGIGSLLDEIVNSIGNSAPVLRTALSSSRWFRTGPSPVAKK